MSIIDMAMNASIDSCGGTVMSWGCVPAEIRARWKEESEARVNAEEQAYLALKGQVIKDVQVSRGDYEMYGVTIVTDAGSLKVYLDCDECGGGRLTEPEDAE